MSPHNVWPSQATTVARKLPTIRPTPIVTETATMSAAMATAVRLSAPVTLREARRPNTPKTRLVSGRLPRSSPRVTTGASSAKPMVTQKMPAKLMVSASPGPSCPTSGSDAKARGGRASSNPPPASPASPANAVTGTARRARSSMLERESARRGGADAASQAGSAAETTVAARPITAPLTRLSGAMTNPRTVTTK